MRLLCSPTSGRARVPRAKGEMASIGGSVSKALWDVRRFGLTPSKLVRRVHDPGAPRVFCVSIPKAGTHLLERALCLHPELYRKLIPTVIPRNVERWGGMEGLARRIRPGQVVVSHIKWDPAHPRVLQAAGVHTVFLVRDPRDIVVSYTHYATSDKDHRFRQQYLDREELEDRLRI